ncbi:MAG: lamin tail domain-containing protein [Chloroflexota bacterium]
MRRRKKAINHIVVNRIVTPPLCLVITLFSVFFLLSAGFSLPPSDGGSLHDDLSPSPTPTCTSTPSPTNTDTQTATFTPTTTPSPTDMLSATPTDTPSSPPADTPIPPLFVLINEIAWSGTAASANDEWIELFNPSAETINLNNWILRSLDGSPTIGLQGLLLPGGFFLLERTDDTTVSDIPADMIYTGALSNSGEILQLIDPNGNIIDTVNATGGSWYAGDIPNNATMERVGAQPDAPTAWGTNNGLHTNGLDANGNPLRGTPKQMNSVLFPAASPTATDTFTPSLPTATSTSTPTPISTSTPTPTSTSSPTPETATPFSVLINEVAWSGTHASANDEWIELFNPNALPVDLNGWTLLSNDGSPSIALQGTILAGSFYLLERTDDTTVSDIPADLIYTGSLSNSGEALHLLDPQGNVIDTANVTGGPWPAGNASNRATMERKGVQPDTASAWGTNTGFHTNGLDVAGNPIRGTPKQPNSVLFPTPTPTPTRTPTPLPGIPHINEFLPYPRFDWNGDGQINTGDEFIEIVNLGPGAVNLKGWLIDDSAGGSHSYRLPAILLQPGEMIVFFKTATGISISDRGDGVHLSNPDGLVMDKYEFSEAREWNLSWCRLPDGWGGFHYPCWPTPGYSNAVYLPSPMILPLLPSPTFTPTPTLMKPLHNGAGRHHRHLVYM